MGAYIQGICMGDIHGNGYSWQWRQWRGNGGNDRGEHIAIRNLTKIGFQSHKETI